jgi:hypothetical protein
MVRLPGTDGRSNAKLAVTLGFNPSRSVVAAVSDLLRRIELSDVDAPDDPRFYNVRWTEQLHEPVG